MPDETEFDWEQLRWGLDRLALGFESADPKIRHEAKWVAVETFSDLADTLNCTNTDGE